ncbi:hypothetical protein BUQ74_17275 [Leptospira weilii serovar Heyan]|nr:hypothetical protein BUQ74_17275 [Leptospira weilii serovar Heyan]
MRNKFLIDLARDLMFHPLIFQTPQEKTERNSNIIFCVAITKTLTCRVNMIWRASFLEPKRSVKA